MYEEETPGSHHMDDNGYKFDLKLILVLVAFGFVVFQNGAVSSSDYK